jgi:hypothetical protein
MFFEMPESSKEQMVTTTAPGPRKAPFNIHLSPALPRPILTVPLVQPQHPVGLKVEQDPPTSTNIAIAPTRDVQTTAHHESNSTDIDVLELSSPGTGFFVMGAWAVTVTVMVFLSLWRECQGGSDMQQFQRNELKYVYCEDRDERNRDQSHAEGRDGREQSASVVSMV